LPSPGGASGIAPSAGRDRRPAHGSPTVAPDHARVLLAAQLLSPSAPLPAEALGSPRVKVWPRACSVGRAAAERRRGCRGLQGRPL